jgi:hypothetical protein
MLCQIHTLEVACSKHTSMKPSPNSTLSCEIVPRRTALFFFHCSIARKSSCPCRQSLPMTNDPYLETMGPEGAEAEKLNLASRGTVTLILLRLASRLLSDNPFFETPSPPHTPNCSMLRSPIPERRQDKAQCIDQPIDQLIPSRETRGRSPEAALRNSSSRY